MYSIESHIGRLIEVRFWSPILGGEAIGWKRDHEIMLHSVLGSYLFFVDMSEANVFPPDMVDAWAATLKREPRLVRTAFLLGSSPTFALQIQRIVRDAQHPQRRVCRDAREAEQYLGEVVTAAERTRLREVLERRAELGGPSSAQPPISAPAPSSVGPPGSMRAPLSVRGGQPSTMRIPAVPRSSSSGSSGSGRR